MFDPTEVIQDIDGGISAKRVTLFVLLFLLVGLIIAQVLFHVPVAQTMLDSVIDLLKWIGGFVASEQLTKFSKSNTVSVNLDKPPTNSTLPWGQEPYEGG